MAAQRPPESPRRDDDPRREEREVGVYHDDRAVVDETTDAAPGSPAADPVVQRDLNDEPRTAPRPGPTTYDTTEPASRGGVPLITWVTIAIVAIIILWLLFEFVF